jgi:hypothetical protein
MHLYKLKKKKKKQKTKNKSNLFLYYIYNIKNNIKLNFFVFYKIILYCLYIFIFFVIIQRFILSLI